MDDEHVDGRSSIRITIEQLKERASTAGPTKRKIFDVARYAVDTGIPDLGLNHDHYLYGHPKVTDGD